MAPRRSPSARASGASRAVSAPTAAATRRSSSWLRTFRIVAIAATTAIATIRNVRSQLDDRLVAAAVGADTARLAPLARALGERLGAIEQALYQVRNRSFQDPLNFPPGPLERISGLVGVVAGTDARPTAQSYDVFRIFAADIQKQLVALKLALGRDLPALNRALRSASAAAIAPRAAEVRPPAAER